MREGSHFKDFGLCYLSDAVIVGLDAKLYHPGKEATVFLVKLTCQDEMLAQFGKCAVVRLCCYAARNEGSVDYMITGIVEPIGCQTPSPLKNHVVSFLQEPLRLLRL